MNWTNLTIKQSRVCKQFVHRVSYRSKTFDAFYVLQQFDNTIVNVFNTSATSKIQGE